MAQEDVEKSGKNERKSRQVVIFNLGDEEFGVDIKEIREIIRMDKITPIPNTADYIRGVINLRGKIIVILDLAAKLGIHSDKPDDKKRIIIIETDKNTTGMIVDSAKEIMNLTSEHLKEAPAYITKKIDSDYIEGVGIIDERLIILLDLAKVLRGNDAETIKDIEKQSSFLKQQIKIETTKESKTPNKEKLSEENSKYEKISPTLKDVGEEFHFITHEGKPLRNVHELLDYIKNLDGSTFRSFVNEEKNDFYEWIKHSVKDDHLAERIKNIKSKEDITQEIMKRILSTVVEQDKK